MRFLTVIPARFGSSRLPGKPLALIGNSEQSQKTMIEWVYQNALSLESQFKNIVSTVVATDDSRIFDQVKTFDGNVVMTSGHHVSGTDRIYEVVKNWKEPGKDFDAVINIQGDEPFLKPIHVAAAVQLFENQSLDMATLSTPFLTKSELENPSMVKVIVDKGKNAIYFSRLSIPYGREIAPEIGPWKSERHIGLYIYKKSVLETLSKTASSPLENAESLEQLRALELGYRIGVCTVQYEGFGIDTPEDLIAAQNFFKRSKSI
jgi:3-deoxy-manno-octulosonate cytidylyltransferase (CMP-KDO synthetase)